MPEKVVEIAVQEIKALKGFDDLFPFATLAAVDGFNDHIGSDDVAVASDMAFDFVGADVEVFFSKESGESHLLVCGGVAPGDLIMGYTPAICQQAKENPHRSGGSPARRIWI